MMKVLLRYLESDDPPWVGITYAAVMLLCMILQTVFTNIYHQRVFILGELNRSSGFLSYQDSLLHQ